MRLQSSDMSVVEGNDGDMNTVDVCLELVHAWTGLERELQFSFSIAAQGTAGTYFSLLMNMLFL